MKQNLTINETYFLLGLVIITVIFSLYTIYLYIYYYKYLQSIYSGSDIFAKVKKSYQDKKYYFIDYLQFFMNMLYLITSIYFIVNNKIKNVLFGLVCLFMFTKGLLYIYREYLLSKNNKEINSILLKNIHCIIAFDNILGFFVSLYFLKIIFLN